MGQVKEWFAQGTFHRRTTTGCDDCILTAVDCGVFSLDDENPSKWSQKGKPASNVVCPGFPR